MLYHSITHSSKIIFVVSSDSPSKLFPVFLAFARQVHPMLNCIDQVKKISDLRGPADL